MFLLRLLGHQSPILYRVALMVCQPVLRLKMNAVIGDEIEFFICWLSKSEFCGCGLRAVCKAQNAKTAALTLHGSGVSFNNVSH